MLFYMVELRYMNNKYLHLQYPFTFREVHLDDADNHHKPYQKRIRHPHPPTNTDNNKTQPHTNTNESFFL